MLNLIAQLKFRCNVFENLILKPSFDARTVKCFWWVGLEGVRNVGHRKIVTDNTILTLLHGILALRVLQCEKVLATKAMH
eukprot:5359249-Amphidinium_carterae.1